MKTKKELILDLVSRVLDIEENSNKRVMLRYSGHVQMVEFYVIPNEEDYHNYLCDFKQWNMDKLTERDIQNFEKSLVTELEKAKIAPETSPEKMINLRVTESKAKELGLVGT